MTRITSTYKVKIRDSHGVFLNTAKVYRQAIDFLFPKYGKYVITICGRKPTGKPVG